MPKMSEKAADRAKAAKAKAGASGKAPSKNGKAHASANGKAPAKKAGGGKRKDGLRNGQVRILQFLSKAKGPQARKVIAERAPVDQANCVELIGSAKPDVRAANDTKHYPCLITLGHVKQEMHDVDGKDVVLYSITDKGRKALLSV